VVLACQVSWSQYTEAALVKGDLPSVQQVLRVVEATLNVLADSVLHEQPAVRRRKLEHLVSLITFVWKFLLSGRI
jgi:dynein heavy chain 1